MKAIGIILAGGNNKRMKELSYNRAIAAMPMVGTCLLYTSDAADEL